jgi:phage shock protein PspC (stress-responsive transcriptional regulator)
MKKLVRPREGRKIAGVALGVANYFSLDATLVRIIWAFLLVPGGVPGLVPYLICWLLMPEEA